MNELKKISNIRENEQRFINIKEDKRSTKVAIN
jgi:hypothetical protein